MNPRRASISMIDLSNVTINTAGAYITVNGLYLFALGADLHDGRIPVYRIGGHRQEDETAWECVLREASEETGLHIRPLEPERTYQVAEHSTEIELQEIEWRREGPHEPAPLLVRAVYSEGKTLLSVMYLAQADELPTPSSEVKGLLLLDEENIYALCQRPLTLEQYLANGGQAILKHEFDQNLILEPFLQLRALSKLLELSTLTRITL